MISCPTSTGRWTAFVRTRAVQLKGCLTRLHDVAARLAPPTTTGLTPTRSTSPDRSAQAALHIQVMEFAMLPMLAPTSWTGGAGRTGDDTITIDGATRILSIAGDAGRDTIQLFAFAEARAR